jgi:hypothetical protein
VQKVFIFMFLVIQLYVLTWWFFSLVCSKFSAALVYVIVYSVAQTCTRKWLQLSVNCRWGCEETCLWLHNARDNRGLVIRPCSYMRNKLYC